MLLCRYKGWPPGPACPRTCFPLHMECLVHAYPPGGYWTVTSASDRALVVWRTSCNVIGDPLQSSFDDIYWQSRTMYRAVARITLVEPALGGALTGLLVLTLCLELPQASATQGEHLSLSLSHGGATTTGLDATHPPTIFQNSGGGGGGGGGAQLGGGPAGGRGGGGSSRGVGGGGVPAGGREGGVPAGGRGGGVWPGVGGGGLARGHGGVQPGVRGGGCLGLGLRLGLGFSPRVRVRVRVTELVEPVLVL